MAGSWFTLFGRAASLVTLPTAPGVTGAPAMRLKTPAVINPGLAIRRP